MASNTNRDLIPIFYKLPFDCRAEIVSGYLEKKKLPYGSQTKKFYGHFKCMGCNAWWKSSNTYQGYTQGCKKCRRDSWPIKVYHLEQSADIGARGPHISSLCERCLELGHNCNTGADLDNNIDVNNRSSHNRSTPVTIYDQCYQKQYQLLRYEIILEPNFIRDLYVRLWDGLSDRERGEFQLGLETALNEWIKKRRDDLVQVCREILHQIRARRNQNRPVLPDHYRPHVSPVQNSSHLFSDQNRSPVLPDQNPSYTLPDQDLTLRYGQFTRATAEVGVVGLVAQAAVWLFEKAFGNN